MSGFVNNAKQVDKGVVAALFCLSRFFAVVFHYSYLRVIKKSHPEESIQQDLINSVA